MLLVITLIGIFGEKPIQYPSDYFSGSAKKPHAKLLTFDKNMLVLIKDLTSTFGQGLSPNIDTVLVLIHQAVKDVIPSDTLIDN